MGQASIAPSFLSPNRTLSGAAEAKSEAAWVALGSAMFALCFGYPILRHLSLGNVPSNPPQSDWDFSLQLNWVAFDTITRFHQFPLWNPYKCGGMPMLGNPQSGFLSPLFILTLLFGPVVGIRLAIVAHIAIAFGGAYFLARMLGISKLGAVACAGAFAGSSWCSQRVEIGHMAFLAFAYVPWAVALLYLSLERRRMIFTALGGLMMALMLAEGGVYPLSQAALMLAALAPMIGFQRRSFLPLAAVTIMGVFAAGFAAIKLLPSYEWIATHARPSPSADLWHPRVFLAAFFWREGVGGEVAAYLGVFFAAFALVGAVLRFRRALPWTMLSLLLLTVAVGNFAPYSPWALLQRLPLFDSMRMTPRWLILFTLTAGVLAGFGVDVLCSVAESAMRIELTVRRENNIIYATAKPWGAIIAPLLIGLALIDNWFVSTPHLRLVEEGEEAPLIRSANFRQVAGAKYGWQMFAAGQANMGVLNCYEPNAFPVNPRGYAQPGYRGEQYLVGAGSVTLSRWTPNRLSFDIEAPSPTMLVVNQNYDPGWRLVEGQGIAISSEGLIAVMMPAGRQHIELAYRSRPFMIGLWISLLTVAAMLLLWRYEHRCGKRLAGISGWIARIIMLPRRRYRTLEEEGR